MSDIVVIGRREYGTGLQVPRNRESGLQLFSSVQPMMTRDQINKLLTSKNRMRARKRFDRTWIKMQFNLGACFPPGTLVRMKDGSQRSIEDVKLLDEVLTAEGNIRKVIRTMVRYHSEDIYRVCLWGHRHLRCTSEHPLLTKRGYVAAKDLTPSDWVAIPRYAPELVTEFVPYSLIKQPIGAKTQAYEKQAVGARYCGIPGRKFTKVEIRELPEKIELDYDFGYLMGLFVAEGHISAHRICYTFNAKEEHTLAKKVCQIFEEKFGIEPAVRVRQNKCEVRIYGTLWSKLFYELCGTGSKEKRLHALLTSSPVECLAGILRGWMDGDGIGVPDEWGGVSISHSLTMNMYDIATKLGYNPCVETHQPKINPKHKIKSRQLRYILRWPRNPMENPSKNCKEVTETHVWRKVHKIETEPYSGYVYNLEVEGDNSYVAESIGVHNCNGFALAAGAERIRVKRGLPRRKYSGFAMYAAINGGVDRGSQLKDGNVWSSTKGVPEEIAGEKPEYRWSRIPQVQKDSMKNNIMLEPLVINDELELAVASVMGYPVIVACHASARWGSLDGDGIGGASDGMGNHAVLVDDIVLSRSGEWLFDTANSWDVDWGDEGRLYQTWKRHFRTPIKYHQFYALRTTIDGDFQGPVIQGTPFARRAA